MVLPGPDVSWGAEFDSRAVGRVVVSSVVELGDSGAGGALRSILEERLAGGVRRTDAIVKRPCHQSRPIRSHQSRQVGV